MKQTFQGEVMITVEGKEYIIIAVIWLLIGLLSVIIICVHDMRGEPYDEDYFKGLHTIGLRTDQILFLFSAALKSVCNKFNVYLGSATQLNDNYKEDNNKDAGALKGSKAIIEKADGGILALPVTHKDLKRLKPILESDGSFGSLIPNMSYYIFKNRGGKWKTIIIWTKLNMGTMREVDCFVTDYNYELITDIEKTLIDFRLDDVGDVGIIETDIDVSGSDLAMQLSK